MNVMAGFAAHSEPFSQRVRKVVLVCGDDGFVPSHCRVLVGVLGAIGREVVTIARSTGRLGEVEALGTRVIDFDCRLRWRSPLRDMRAGWNLASILEAEGAD